MLGWIKMVWSTSQKQRQHFAKLVTGCPIGNNQDFGSSKILCRAQGELNYFTYGRCTGQSTFLLSFGRSQVWDFHFRIVIRIANGKKTN